MSLPCHPEKSLHLKEILSRAFIKASKQGVEARAGKADCLYYLEQFTTGRPQELVRSCQHMTPERGYTVAKSLLQEHFGNSYKVAAAYMERALACQQSNLRMLNLFKLIAYSCGAVVM